MFIFRDVKKLTYELLQKVLRELKPYVLYISQIKKGGYIMYLAQQENSIYRLLDDIPNKQYKSIQIFIYHFLLFLVV